MPRKLSDMIQEAVSESWHEGFHTAIYNHREGGHTPENRKAMMNHKRICMEIREEIENELKAKAEGK